MGCFRDSVDSQCSGLWRLRLYVEEENQLAT